jgi:DNA polymerase-3 subunit delta'
LEEAELDQALAAYLPEMGSADRAALAGLAEGSPGRALALAEEGGLKLAGMVAEVLAAAPDFPLLRAYAFSDALREQAAFETFMGLLQRGVAAAVAAHVRGTADAAQARLVAARSVVGLAETAEALGRLVDETERVNMDRRQAVVAGLALLR